MSRNPRGVDLLRAMPAFRRLVACRWFPLGLVVPLFVALLGLLSAGFVGTPVGNRNGLVVSVWILWWFLVIAVSLPLFARTWCAVCPIPFLGEWLQRRTLLGVRSSGAGAGGVVVGRNRYAGLGRRWPRRLSNLWLQTVAFLLLATLSAWLLTSALATALTISLMVVAATAIAVAFRQRSFCRFLCPVGGFLGLFSMPAPIAVRARDSSVCAACRDKACVAGNERGWGCPWLVNPSRLDRNNSCGLCLECLKSCRQDNMSLFVRAPLQDRRLTGSDEAWKAFVMVALALSYSLVYLGPWGFFRNVANVAEGGDWSSFLTYAGALWTFALIVVPGAFFAAAWLGRRLAGRIFPVQRLALAGAAGLVPFGLLSWIAFSLPLVLVNGSYVVAAVSDPFGRGWNLLGTAGLAWTPILPESTPWLQAGLVLAAHAIGLGTAWLETREVAGAGRRGLAAFAPTGLLITVLALTLLWLYTG